MKYIGYFLSVLASAAALSVSAADSLRVKPKHIAPPPAAQHWAAPTRMSLQGTADGVPDGLHMVGVDDKTVTLQWNSPEPTDGYYDDFEGHPDFVINSPGSVGWEYLDMDNEQTYTWAATSFPNQGNKMAFIVMNVAKTTPSVVADYPDAKPYSGTKMLVDFAVQGQSNDFIISPELNFDRDFQISFRAKSYNDTYGLERIRVGYSTTGKRASDFIWVSDGDYVEVPTTWTLMSYKIPKDAKYVTINCVSNDAFMLFIDDIFVGTNNVRPLKAAASNPLVGFNLYRNSVKVNAEPIVSLVYSDDVPDYGNYTYTVTAVYEDGTETGMSEPVNVEVPDIRLLPFEDDFSSWVLDADKWSTPADDAGNPSKWSVDYYTYGLVDPCAAYQYSSLKNYSQSLISRQLNTTDVKNTWLRFDLRMLNYNSTTGDTLSVEVSCDGKNWTRCKYYLSDEGTYSWRQELIDLSPYLTGNLFQVRFRAHGEEAFYIDYWYVDDIKVWNPEWTSASLTVLAGGTPFAGCSVSLEGDGGGRYNAKAGADGKISFEKIEADTYTIIIDEEGHNLYKGKWIVENSSANDEVVNVTTPVLSVSETELHEDLNVEDKIEKTVTLENTGDGEVMWRMLADHEIGSGDISGRFQLQQSFGASGDLQSAIVFDGEYFYTSSWYNIGKFYKYDRNGRFIEEFDVEGMYYKVDDMAFDGTYFYGSDDTNAIYQLDLRNKRLVKTITIVDDPKINITHIAYDPRSDEFWAGGSNTICRINREGKITSAMRNISDEESLDVYGSAYDNTTPGGPYLWLSHEEMSYQGVDRIVLRQYNLNTRRLTDVKHEVSDTPDYQYTPMIYGAGIETTTSLFDGTLSLVGIMEQSPARIYVYKLCDAGDWLSYSPKAGVLKAGEKQEVKITYNAIKGVVGKDYSADLNIFTLPDVDAGKIDVSYTAVGPCATPRPVELTASSENGIDVNLAWKSGEAEATPSGYNVYRDGVRLNEKPLAETAYVDKSVIRGEYKYTVTAIYNDVETNHSDSVVYKMTVGAPYFAPTGLSASVSENKNVSLAWTQPGLTRQDEATLRYDDGTCSTGVGLADGGIFRIGAKWTGDDLIEHRGMKLDKVDVYVKELCQALSLKIYKDGEAVRTQTVKSSDIKYGQFNTVTLSEPLTVERGHDYIVAFIVAHDAGMMPIGIDAGTAVEGKSNLISTDGSEWSTCSRMGCGTGNVNIAAHFAPADDAEDAPVGYEVFRDDAQITTAPISELTYHDEVTEPGKHVYKVRSVYADGGVSGFTSGVTAEILDLGTPVAPGNINADVELNRTVRLRWDLPVEGGMSFPIDLTTTKVNTNDGCLEYINQFKGYISGEMGVASDGEYIYTTMRSVKGAVNKYTLDGEFVEGFSIDGVDNGILNLAYDGEDFYASTNGNWIYKIDMNKRVATDTISISEVARHLAYIPDLDNGRGGFEVGDWETSIYIDKRGSKLGTGPSYPGAAGTAYYNGVLYAFEQGYENPYVVSMYDLTTGKKMASVDLKDYPELSPETGTAAGGMSLITTKEGLNILALALQGPTSARFIFLDPGTILGLEGYNVYRNDVKVNDKPLKYRSYTTEETDPGTYSYAVQTVYIDGSVSDKSQAATVTIVDAGDCVPPSDIKAVPAECGYNVNLSFVDPATLDAAVYESAEGQTDGSVFAREGWINSNDAWTVTSATAYQGNKSVEAAAGNSSLLIIPVGEADNAENLFSFVARNENDSKGVGSISVYTSSGSSTSEADFQKLSTVTTTENWQKFSFTLPASVAYVALRSDAGKTSQYVDAVSVDTEDHALIHGYYVYRDGVKLNEEPVTAVSYTDHNLLPGTYNYQVSAIYVTSGLSELSEPVTAVVDYSNNYQAPGMLSAEKTSDGVQLYWSAPAIGDGINLRWHSGTAHDAAGLPSGGGYFAGVQWTSDDLQSYGHLSLSEVEVYVNNVPDQMFLLVYEGTDLVRQQYVTNLRQYSFNNIKLNTPLQINPDRTLRVVLYVEHNEISVPLGYDEGPAVVGKGDLYSSDGTTWETLTDNDIDGNWNITIVLRPYADFSSAAQAPAFGAFNVASRKAPSADVRLRTQAVSESTSPLFGFEGYNVYCNGGRLTAAPIAETSYLDNTAKTTEYNEYQVKAVYSGYGEVGSNIVRVFTSGIETVDGNDGIRITADGSSIYVYGLEAGMPVFVYDSAGHVVATATARSADAVCIDMNSRPEGIYLVKAGSKVAKLNVTRK